MGNPYLEARFEDGREAWTVPGSFETGLKLLRLMRAVHMNCADFAQLWIKGGVRDFGARGYTSHAFVYSKGKKGILVRSSPLDVEDLRLTERAVKYGNSGHHFENHEDSEMYDRYFWEARGDSDKVPERRRAILLPSVEPFDISPSVNFDFFKFLYGDVGEKYLQTIGLEKLKVYPLREKEVERTHAPIVSQLWVNGNREIGLYGDYAIQGDRLFDIWNDKVSGLVDPSKGTGLDDLLSKIKKQAEEGKVPFDRLYVLSGEFDRVIDGLLPR